MVVHVSPALVQKLFDLQEIWEDLYHIRFNGEVWSAVCIFRPADTFTAETPEELRDQIKKHHENLLPALNNPATTDTINAHSEFI